MRVKTRTAWGRNRVLEVFQADCAGRHIAQSWDLEVLRRIGGERLTQEVASEGWIFMSEQQWRVDKGEVKARCKGSEGLRARMACPAHRHLDLLDGGRDAVR